MNWGFKMVILGGLSGAIVLRGGEVESAWGVVGCNERFYRVVSIRFKGCCGERYWGV